MLSDRCLCVCVSVCLVTLVYSGQMVGWIKMPLGTEVGLGPGHTVLDGEPALPRKGKQQPPLFGLRLLWPNGRPSQQRLSYVMWPGVPLFWPGRPELSCCGQKEISYVDFLFTRITYTLYVRLTVVYPLILANVNSRSRS